MKEKMGGFKFFRGVLKPIYRFWYRPKVIGKENIPESGPIVLAGNHIHIMDQCNVIIATKRPIHYLAKKEYFDNKKVAWFFKASGCIPVDRSKKDEHATSSAIEVLNEKKALGIFPEGTRNGLKDEKIEELYHTYFEKDYKLEDFHKKVKKNKTSFVNYLIELMDDKKITLKEFKEKVFDSNEFLKELIEKKTITKKDYYEHILLPLKFGAVSLAHKTDAMVVPYAITGDYKFRTKNLVVRIGKPFSVGEDLEKANHHLEEEIRRLYQESEKESGK